MKLTRCAWVPLDNPDYLAYHDTEWGVAAHDDRLLFEMLVLESAQAGLSWNIILRKRANYRQAFAQFDIASVASYDDNNIEKLIQDAGIVRNRKKIEAAVRLARIAQDIQRESGSLDAYLWSFLGGHTLQPAWHTLAEVPTSSPEAAAMSADLRARGASFVGPTICYSFMQAVGMVNDHTIDCFRHAQLAIQS